MFEHHFSEYRNQFLVDLNFKIRLFNYFHSQVPLFPFLFCEKKVLQIQLTKSNYNKKNNWQWMCLQKVISPVHIVTKSCKLSAISFAHRANLIFFRLIQDCTFYLISRRQLTEVGSLLVLILLIILNMRSLVLNNIN